MTAAELLLRAYANGEVNNHIEWSELDAAFEQAKEENPGLWEQIIGAPCYCQNCEWEGSEHELERIQDPEQRIAPGEPYPAGECPECGCLAHRKAEPISASTDEPQPAEDPA